MFDAVQGGDLGRTRGLPHGNPAVTAGPGPATLEVLFKLNSAAISGPDAESLKAAAAQAANAKSLRVDIVGHTDSLGNAAANKALALRRARSVADILAQAGIPAEAMSIRALGDEKPAVADGPGVSEPANRRVEIIFH
jgi:outer membrane protein OmpA-like peptidoglycan-associated protein